MTTIAPEAHVRRPHVSTLLVAVAAAGIVVALAALAGWLLVREGGGRTSDEVLVDNVLAAWNARDGDALGRLYTTDAVVTFGASDEGIVGRAAIQETAKEWWNTVTKVGEPTTLDDPPTGFRAPDESIGQHYVVTPVLIHDDPFVVVLDVRGGKVATHMVFEPFEPIRS